MVAGSGHPKLLLNLTVRNNLTAVVKLLGPLGGLGVLVLAEDIVAGLTLSCVSWTRGAMQK